MKGIKTMLAAGGVLVLLCQCATQDDVRKLNYQLRAVNQKVEEVKTSTVDQIRKKQASSVSKIDRVDEELARLKALIEENTTQVARNLEQNQAALASLQSGLEQRMTASDQKIQELEQRLDRLTAALEAMQKARLDAAERRAREAARKAEEARRRTVMAARPTSRSGSLVHLRASSRKTRVGQGRTVAAASAPARPAATSSAGTEQPVAEKKPAATVETVTATDTASGPFDQAMARFKAGDYKEAYRLYEQVLANNPSGRQAAQTLFYMGEALYNQGEYDLAILDYQKVISNHARDAHAPAALLKQGMSFEKLTDNETAKIIYKKLIKEYGSTPEADKAKKRLKNL